MVPEDGDHEAAVRGVAFELLLRTYQTVAVAFLAVDPAGAPLVLEAAQSEVTDLILGFLCDHPEMVSRTSVLTAAARRVQDALAREGA